MSRVLRVYNVWARRSAQSEYIRVAIDLSSAVIDVQALAVKSYYLEIMTR